MQGAAGPEALSHTTTRNSFCLGHGNCCSGQCDIFEESSVLCLNEELKQLKRQKQAIWKWQPCYPDYPAIVGRSSWSIVKIPDMKHYKAEVKVKPS